MRTSHADVICLAALGLIWVVMAALANPIGDFPLNDDWVYGLAVKSILEQGEFRMPSPASTDFFPQAYWGALFCLPFGFSFTALRVSTLVLGIIGIAATYGVVRQLGAGVLLALLAAALVAGNPLYFALANTFMTDVPFFAVSTASLYCLVRWARDPDHRAAWPGLVLAMIAILIRQVGIVLPLGFAAAYVSMRGFRGKALAIALLPTVIGAALHFAFQAWLQQTGRTPFSSEPPLQDIFFANLHAGPRVPLRLYTFFAYAGLFALPLLVVAGRHAWGRSDAAGRKLGAMVFFAVVALSVPVLFVLKMPMPFLDNILNPYGGGPLTLTDSFFYRRGLPEVPSWLTGLWFGLTAAAIAGAGLLASLSVHVARGLARSPRWGVGAPAMLVVGAAGVAYVVLVMLATRFFLDRYMLFVLLCALLVAGFLAADTTSPSPVRRGGALLALIVVVLQAAWSVVMTRDYLEWNRTRWVATAALLADGVPRTSIDGGYEFNGWLGFDAAYQRKQGKSPWWVVDDDYMIASGPISGFTVYRTYQVPRLLTGGYTKVLVLRKDRP